jgi:hypothetical protein
MQSMAAETWEGKVQMICDRLILATDKEATNPC